MPAPTGRLHRSRLPLRAALVVLLLVSACSDPEQPATLPDDTPSVKSPSASPTSMTPEEQIDETLTEYFNEANKAFRTGNTEGLRKYTSPACPCRGLADDIRKTYESGGRYQSARYNVEFVKVSNLVGKTASAEVRARVPAYQVIDKSGRVLEDSSGGFLHSSFALVQQESGRWLITNSFDLS